MRIVDCLEKVIICPNCGAGGLMKVEHPMDFCQSKWCSGCHEEIYEKDKLPSAISTKEGMIYPNAKTRKEEVVAFEEREELLMDARDLLHDLPLFARTSNELDTLTQIANIFDKILTLLEKE